VAFEITCLSALEIIDSVARPTLEVGVHLADGARANALVPTGAPNRWSHAVELRDHDATRFHGDGVLTARDRIRREISAALLGRTWFDLAEVDQALASLDSDPNTPALGSNATMGVSMALARALAHAAARPLHAWIPNIGQPHRMPMPIFSMLSGKANIPNLLAFSSFLICPVGAPSLSDAVRAGVEIYHSLKRRLDHDGLSRGISADGGHWCGLSKPELGLRLLVNAIRDAGYPAGRDGIAIAIDAGASAMRREDGAYQVGNETLSSSEMISWYAELVDAFPIRSIEDGLGADDLLGWQSLTSSLGERVQLVGDDLLCSQPVRIQRAVDTGMGNAAAIKLDHVPTVSQALQSIRLCHDLGFGQVVTQSEGETGDSFIADLTIGSGCGQLSAGAPVRGERVAKYNRLIQIAAGSPDLPYGIA